VVGEDDGWDVGDGSPEPHGFGATDSLGAGEGDAGGVGDVAGPGLTSSGTGAGVDSESATPSAGTLLAGEVAAESLGCGEPESVPLGDGDPLGEIDGDGLGEALGEAEGLTDGCGPDPPPLGVQVGDGRDTGPGPTPPPAVAGGVKW
jgi:hypothetical protein